MEEQKQSPSVSDTKMTFCEAILQILVGKKVHKLEWQNKEFYGFLNAGVLSLHKPDGQNYQWVVSEGDLRGEDYVVV